MNFTKWVQSVASTNVDRRRHVEYKWIVLSVTTIGVLMAAIDSTILGTLRQGGMVTSFALALAVAASSLPRDVMLQLFVGTNVTLGSQVMQAFVIGIHSAFLVSIGVSVLAAGLSLVRGKEERRG